MENEGDDVIERHSVTNKSRPSGPCAHFIHTLQTRSPPRFTIPGKKPVFRPLFADLGHFLTSDVILKENFCRLASIWRIDLMKLFALGRIDSAVVRKLWLAGKVAKFTEMVVIPAAHFEFCRRRVTPSGPPVALTSSTGGVVAGHRFHTLSITVCVHRWWELFLLVDIAVFNGFRSGVVYGSSSFFFKSSFYIIVTYGVCSPSFFLAFVSLLWFVITQPPTPKF